LSSVDLSIVVPVYNEHRGNLEALTKRLRETVARLQLKHEIVFVDDGGTEQSAAMLKDIVENADDIRLLTLSRNFGQQAAVSAGLADALGRAVVTMDSDCQDPPEVVAEMVGLWRQGYDVVYAQRRQRDDRVFKQLSASTFYRLLNAMSTVEIPLDTGEFRLLDRAVVDALNRLPEKNRYLRGLVPWLGFRQTHVLIDRGARKKGESTYTLRKLMRLALDGLLSFAVAPLYLLFGFGLILLAAGFGCLAFKLVFGTLPITAIDLLWIGLTIFSGLQITAIGIVGSYLAKILEEVKGRPTFIVAKRIGKDVVPTASYGEMEQQTESQTVR
jgi:glycosyltransferase involved in cell wall biosynthesis